MGWLNYEDVIQMKVIGHEQEQRLGSAQKRLCSEKNALVKVNYIRVVRLVARIGRRAVFT